MLRCKTRYTRTGINASLQWAITPDRSDGSRERSTSLTLTASAAYFHNHILMALKKCARSLLSWDCPMVLRHSLAIPGPGARDDSGPCWKSGENFLTGKIFFM